MNVKGIFTEILTILHKLNKEKKGFVQHKEKKSFDSICRNVRLKHINLSQNHARNFDFLKILMN